MTTPDLAHLDRLRALAATKEGCEAMWVPVPCTCGLDAALDAGQAGAR